MRIDIHHYHHFDGAGDDVLKELRIITLKINNMAKAVDTMREVLAEINNSTNNIAADIERLADQAEGGVAPEDAAAFTAELRTTATALKAVADKNPEPGTPEA